MAAPTRFFRLLLSSLVVIFSSFSVVAQTHDSSVELVSVEVPSWPTGERAPVGEVLYYALNWSVGGPEVSRNLVLELDLPGGLEQTDGTGVSCIAGEPVRCTFSGDVFFGQLRFAMRVTTAGTQSMVARLEHAGGLPDPNPANNIARHTFEGVALPSILVSSLISFPHLLPRQAGAFTIVIDNTAATAATNVVSTITLPEGGTIRSGHARPAGTSCSVTDDVLTCLTPALPEDARLLIDVDITAPERLTGEAIAVDIVVASTEPDFDARNNHRREEITLVRQFVVSNVSDDGAGSLRQAILDVNSLCGPKRPCGILFRIPQPVPVSGWFTIQPQTPLPQIVGAIEIDGDAQTAFTGNTNLDGPEIEIDGSLLVEQSGLRLRPVCEASVHGLAVNRFPAYGIEARNDYELAGPCGRLETSATIRGNYLGVDPRGRVAKPNQRGAGVFTAYAHVENNLISGNLRSGVYLERGVIAEVVGNRIGVGTDGSPIGNGCGIFMNLGDGSGLAVYADIEGNVIANNDMSIGRTRVGEILVTQNAIYDNVMQAIDVDLDGLTQNREDDRDVPNRPLLFSATYDAVRGATIVRGRVDSNAYANRRLVEVFASARLSVWAEPQAERSLVVHPLDGNHQDFEIVIPQDLRGQWITATHHALRYTGLLKTPRALRSESHEQLLPGNTSELSDAIVAH